MDPGSPARPSDAPPRPRHRGLFQAGSWRLLGLVALVIVLVVVMVCSVAYGSKQIPFGAVRDGLLHYNPDLAEHRIIHSLRVPRTILGVLVGTSLGLAGAVMQGVARNPLADPGILGVNAGAALFV